MASVMLLDHIPHITGIVSPMWEGIFHAMTRYVGVWFAFMAMEGFIHIRNLKNYSKMNPKIVHIVSQKHHTFSKFHVIPFMAG